MAASLVQKKCVPCEGGTPPLEKEKIQEYLSELKGSWELEDNKKIKRTFTFKTFREGIEFVNRVADIAEEENHHPDIHILYTKVTLVLTTHAMGGLSENDFIMAAKIDLLHGWKEKVEKYITAKISRFLSFKVLIILISMLLVILLFQRYV